MNKTLLMAQFKKLKRDKFYVENLNIMLIDI